VVKKWANPDFFTDYQDSQYVESSMAACSGVANLLYTPTAMSAITAAGGNSTTARYELGGIELIDLKSRSIFRSVPISKWSKAGHSVNRNPMKLVVNGGKLTMCVAPDDGYEQGGTYILIFEARYCWDRRVLHAVMEYYDDCG
jgi:hypothetical protein